MSDDFREQLHRNFSQKETNELIEIWQTNNHVEWTELTFDVIREILQERLVELPPQNEPVLQTNEVEKIETGESTRMTFVQIYFSFNGRIGLETFWLMGFLPLFALGTLLGLLEAATSTYSAYYGVLIILRLLLIWPALALNVKRWHDRDKSGLWVLIVLIPILGPLWALVETGFLPGTKGPNDYGSKSF